MGPVDCLYLSSCAVCVPCFQQFIIMVCVIRWVVVGIKIKLASSEICVVGMVVFGQAAGVYRFDVVSRYIYVCGRCRCV